MPPDNGTIAARAEPVETVRVLEAVPPAVIVGCAGLKLQVIPAGRPVQLRVIVPASPDFDTICNPTAAEFVPEDMLRFRVERVNVICGEFA